MIVRSGELARQNSAGVLRSQDLLMRLITEHELQAEGGLFFQAARNAAIKLDPADLIAGRENSGVQLSICYRGRQSLICL